MQICNVNIQLVHASPKKLAGAGTPIGIIIQALRYYGTDDTPTQDLKYLVKYLSLKDMNDLKALRKKTLRQVVPHIDRILTHA